MRSRALVLVVHDRDLDLRLLRVGPLRRCYLYIERCYLYIGTCGSRGVLWLTGICDIKLRSLDVNFRGNVGERKIRAKTLDILVVYTPNKGFQKSNAVILKYI